MNYYLSNNEGRFTAPISKYTALRMLIQWGYMGMEFGETVFIEDEDGNLLYKKSWFEKRPTKVRDCFKTDEQSHLYCDNCGTSETHYSMSQCPKCGYVGTKVNALSQGDENV